MANVIERALSNRRFQRAWAAFFSVAALAAALWFAAVPLLESSGALRLQRAMELALIVVGGALGLYLAVRAHRNAAARLLALWCASAAAAEGLFEAGRAVAIRHPSEILSAWIMALIVALGCVWIFSSVKFFIEFPKTVRVVALPNDGAAPGRSKLRWLLSPQVLSLAIGIGAIAAFDWQAGRLASAPWADASLYVLCWVPFAALSLKEARLGGDDRKAIRWVVLGQSIWLALFLATLAVVIALRASGILALDGWTASEQFSRSLIAFFLTGFVVVLMVTLAISILYRGTLDPDLMIRRTWIAAALGVVSGIVFVVLERLAARGLAAALGISTADSLTILAIATAIVIVPLRARIERATRALIDGWAAATAIADGARRCVAIVFADLTGYTALSERSERDALIMAAIFHRDAQAAAGALRGSLIKTIGDAVMLRFERVDDAFAALEALKADYRVHVSAMALEPLAVHAAIHWGEVVLAPSGDMFGASVNLAARLLGAAGADGVVTSGAALQRSALASRAQPMGDLRFKNVEMPVSCFRLA
jgi:class 3 adenylate cyclase